MQSHKEFVLITGASAGIGKALAIEFARRSKSLLLVALPGTGLENVAQEIATDFKVTVHSFCCDLTNEDSPKAIFEWCREVGARVNVLVNNAGFGNLEFFTKTKMSLLDNMLKLNTLSVIRLTHFFISHLRGFKESHILNVSSMAAFLPLPQKSVYAATKSFIYSFSDSLRHELGHDNISVSCLCPGGTMTERVKSSLTGSMNRKKSFFQSPEEVAAEAVAGMYRKQFRIIPGWRNRVMFRVSRILPEFIKMTLIRICFSCATKNNRTTEVVASTPFKTFALLRL
jgi:uncharacterized protein